MVYDEPEEFERVVWWNRWIIRRGNRLIYTAAKARLCVSPQMEQVLGRRYGAAGDVLYPIRSRSLAARDIDSARTLRREGQLVIGYAGNLAYGYGDRLQQLLPIFKEAGTVLRIYSFQAPRFLEDATVEYAGGFTDQQVMWERVQSECDAVILPYGEPEHGHQQLYRTHFPSKLPEYLALGMPVVITGPDYATGMVWAKAHPDACLRISNHDGEMIGSSLQRLRNDPGLRRGLSMGALNAAREEFDPEETKKRFVSAIQGVAEMRGRAKA
jgi:glycosyltransferase involved in cell wall biosynthesis